MFVDNRGRVHVFVDGKVSYGPAEVFGPSRSPNGQTTLHRIRITRVNSNQVDQIWEKSSDHGATWTTVFHGAYSHKKP